MSLSPELNGITTIGLAANDVQRRLLAKAAEREHTSVEHFALEAAVRAAEQQPASRRPKRTPDEVRTMIEEARAEVRKHISDPQAVLNQFFEERRRAAERGE